MAKPINTALLSKIIALAKPYKGLFSLALILSILSALLAPALPYLVNLTLDNLLEGGNLSYITQLCILMIVVLFSSTVIMLFNSYTSSLLGQKVILDLRNREEDRVIENGPFIRLVMLVVGIFKSF
jgi:ATP-binding cassette subfamily B protein